ncbi:MAG: nucleotide exchange factor GrpE [Burkholderiales bacterium]
MQDEERIEPTFRDLSERDEELRIDPASVNLEESLKKAEAAAKENYEAWLRAKAETENTRKRAQTDVANAHKYAIENFAAELLAVKDALEAALSSESPSLEALTSGVELTLKQLENVFQKFNLNEINPVGEKFDPHWHQAINMLETDQPPNTVVNVLQKGYQLNDRVIRPALVTVSRSREGS